MILINTDSISKQFSYDDYAIPGKEYVDLDGNLIIWPITLDGYSSKIITQNRVCQDVINDGLLMVGDISGSEGVPDCYVNLYDFAAFAGYWLSCNDPQIPECEFPY